MMDGKQIKMQCKIKKVTKYTVEGFEITLNFSPEELERFRKGCEAADEVADDQLGDFPEIESILDSINKELKK